jgi:very-short-patch-repair endonuclease
LGNGENQVGKIAVDTARNLRQGSTTAEMIFWETVRKRKVAGKKFLRQHPIRFEYEGKPHFFIADFYCAGSKLVVEIDGKIHENQQARDQHRTNIIEQKGIRVIRFKNEEIEEDISSIIKKLVRYI